MIFRELKSKKLFQRDFSKMFEFPGNGSGIIKKNGGGFQGASSALSSRLKLWRHWWRSFHATIFCFCLSHRPEPNTISQSQKREKKTSHDLRERGLTQRIVAKPKFRTDWTQHQKLTSVLVQSDVRFMGPTASLGLLDDSPENTN